MLLLCNANLCLARWVPNIAQGTLFVLMIKITIECLFSITFSFDSLQCGRSESGKSSEEWWTVWQRSTKHHKNQTVSVHLSLRCHMHVSGKFGKETAKKEFDMVTDGINVWWAGRKPPECDWDCSRGPARTGAYLWRGGTHAVSSKLHKFQGSEAHRKRVLPWNLCNREISTTVIISKKAQVCNE